MIRQDQKQEEDDESSSHEARETVHQQGEGSFRALISSTTESSPILELRHLASDKIMDSDDDNCLSPGEDGDEDEEGDKNFSNNHVSSHLSLDASPEGIDRLANFPLKLHKMLERAEIEGFQTTVSWLLHPPLSGQPTETGKEHGASMDNIDGDMSSTPFKVHNPEKFVQDVIPRFFQMTKFKSFLRQLNIWGFSRDRSKGELNGSYYHKDFVRQDPELCQKMRRTKNKGMYKRGTKGSSPLNKATKRRTANMESIETLSVGKDMNSEDSKLGGTSLPSTSHSVHEVGARRPDLPSLNHRDMRRTRNDSAPFPIAYRPIMRGIEKGREQVFSGDLEVHSPSRQISSQHQQIFLGGGVEAPLLSQFSLNQPTSRYTSGTRQDTCTDRQNSSVFPPPLPTPSREMGPRMLGQGTSFAGAANDPSSSRSANWPQGPQGERRVFSQNVTGQSTAAAGTAPGSVVGEGWRSSRPFVMNVSSTSSLQQDTSMSLGATMPRSSKIAQLLTNPQMPREDLKYILVGFQLGAANKEEDDQSHAHGHASSLGGVEQGPSEPGGEQGPSQN